ncbi:MAG: PIN domain-containing protein [Candidatus Desantisbacteria bacterium]
MKTILCDINIFLDIFLNRQPYYNSSACVFSLVENGKINGYVCSLSFPVMFYLLSKENNATSALKILEKIRAIFRVARVDEKVIDLSLASNFKDFEDAVQYYSSTLHKIDYLITRNKKDYIESGLSVLTPEEFIILYEKKEYND